MPKAGKALCPCLPMPALKKTVHRPAAAAPTAGLPATDRRRQDRRPTLKSSDEAIEAKVRLYQHAAVVRAMPWMAGLSALGAVSVAAAAPPTAVRVPMWIWLFALTVLTLVQWQFWHRCRRQGRPTLEIGRAHV